MSDCRGDLLQRVRRGLASDQERLALGAHLIRCESCALLHDVATDFDHVGEVQLRDIDLVIRFANKARLTVTSSNVVVPRFRKLTPPLKRRSMVVAALVFSGLSAAAYSWSAWSARPAPGILVHSGARHAASVPTSPNADRPDGTGMATVAAVPLPAITQGVGVTELSAVPAKATQLAARSRPETTAAAVYKSANDARRAGQTRTAISLYLQLQSTFSQSTETALSRVSLGGLYLESGSAKAALAQFDAYLTSANRRLAPEALFGRGQALKALGRRAEEIQNWQQLLRRYPSSAYATQAQERLQGLH